jgi:hypothetical protein
VSDVERLLNLLGQLQEQWTDVELAADQIHDPELWRRVYDAGQALITVGNRVALLRREERTTV